VVSKIRAYFQWTYITIILTAIFVDVIKENKHAGRQNIAGNNKFLIEINGGISLW
jgi:hypothetical protein